SSVGPLPCLCLPDRAAKSNADIISLAFQGENNISAILSKCGNSAQEHVVAPIETGYDPSAAQQATRHGEQLTAAQLNAWKNSLQKAHVLAAKGLFIRGPIFSWIR